MLRLAIKLAKIMHCNLEGDSLEKYFSSSLPCGLGPNNQLKMKTMVVIQCSCACWACRVLVGLAGSDKLLTV